MQVSKQVEIQLDGRIKYWYVINKIRYTVLIAKFDPLIHKKIGEYLFSFFTDRRPHTNGDILNKKKQKRRSYFLGIIPRRITPSYQVSPLTSQWLQLTTIQI